MDIKAVYENTLNEIIRLRSELDMHDRSLEGLRICDNPSTNELHIAGLENLKKLANALGTDICRKTDYFYFMYKGVKVFCLGD